MKAGVLAAVAGGVLVLAGCGPRQQVAIDHASAKLLTVSIHDAAQKQDYAAMVDAVDAEFRSPFRTMLLSARDYVRGLEALADAVEKNIGPPRAQRFRRRAAQIYAEFMPSPFEGAVENGQIQWNRVAIFEEGDITAVAVAGKEPGNKSAFDRQFFLRKVKDQWYVAPRQPGVPPAQRKKSYDRETRYVAQTFANYVKLTNDLAKKVRNRSINAANFDEKMAALGATVTPMTPETAPMGP